MLQGKTLNINLDDYLESGDTIEQLSLGNLSEVSTFDHLTNSLKVAPHFGIPTGGYSLFLLINKYDEGMTNQALTIDVFPGVKPDPEDEGPNTSSETPAFQQTV